MPPRPADAHVRVILDVAKPEPGLAQRVRDLLPTVVDVRLDYPEVAETPSEGIAHLDPKEQFVRYYRSQHGGAEPASELLVLFSELYDEVQTVEVGA